MLVLGELRTQGRPQRPSNQEEMRAWAQVPQEEPGNHWGAEQGVEHWAQVQQRLSVGKGH